MKSVRELLATTKIARLSHAIEEDSARTRKDLEAIIPSSDYQKSKVWITGLLSRAGKKRVGEVCSAWNVSESMLVRIALADIISRYGFKYDGLLMPMDYRAVDRHPKSRRPLTTCEEASQNRKKNLVEALDAGGNDAPQPLRVHESRAFQPVEE